MKNKTLTVLFVLGIFICMLDTTIMNVSLPAIGTDLTVGLDSLSWALNVYIILFAALTIPLTRFAEIFGIHKGFLIGVGLFGFGSLASASANDLSLLLIGRALQSVGAALVFPLAMTLGIGLAPVAKRTGMIAILGMTQGIAAALGPVVGGIVTQFLGWQWIFLINIPLTILMMIFGVMNLELQHETVQKQSLDINGAILGIIFLTAFSLGMMQGRLWGWHSWLTIGCFMISIFGFLLFLFVEQKSANPMVPLLLFRDRTFAMVAVLIVLSNVFLVATTVILPHYFVNIAGYSALNSSWLVAPISLAIFVMAPISGFAREKISSKWLLFGGFISIFSGYVLFATGVLTSQIYSIVAGLIIGAGYGLVTGPLLVMAAGSFEGRLLTASQSMSGVLRQVGTMLAVAIFITGLYSNLTYAKDQSKVYAINHIKQLEIPVNQQTKMIERVEDNTSSIAFKRTNTDGLPKQVATTIQKDETYAANSLRQAFEKLYLWALPVVMIGAILSLFLKEKRIKRSVKV